jgi:hypothetical protein
MEDTSKNHDMGHVRIFLKNFPIIIDAMYLKEYLQFCRKNDDCSTSHGNNTKNNAIFTFLKDEKKRKVRKFRGLVSQAQMQRTQMGYLGSQTQWQSMIRLRGRS